MPKPSIIQVPIKKRDSLNIQEVKSILNFLVVLSIVGVKIFFVYSIVPNSFTKTLA